jgi:hypothetical protein
MKTIREFINESVEVNKQAENEIRTALLKIVGNKHYFDVEFSDNLVDHITITFAKGKDSSQWEFGSIRNDEFHFCVILHTHPKGVSIESIHIPWLAIKNTGLKKIRTKSGDMKSIIKHLEKYFKEMMKYI